MEKPIKKIVVEPLLVYREVIQYIEKKYKIDVRRYHETYDKNKPDYREYMDFWHWVVDDGNISNGSPIYLAVDEYLEDDGVPDWIREILTMIKIEFQEDFDVNGGLSLWVSW